MMSRLGFGGLAPSICPPSGLLQLGLAEIPSAGLRSVKWTQATQSWLKNDFSTHGGTRTPTPFGGGS